MNAKVYFFLEFRNYWTIRIAKITSWDAAMEPWWTVVMCPQAGPSISTSVGCLILPYERPPINIFLLGGIYSYTIFLLYVHLIDNLRDSISPFIRSSILSLLSFSYLSLGKKPLQPPHIINFTVTTLNVLTSHFSQQSIYTRTSAVLHMFYR